MSCQAPASIIAFEEAEAHDFLDLSTPICILAESL